MELELQKLNTNGDLVDGAIFNVTGANGYNQDVTVDNGKITIEKLRQGTYTINEKTAPYGYEITEEIKFVVTTEKDTQKIEMKDMPILKNVKVIKVDSETKETIKDKFIFGIYEAPECTKLIKEVKSNKEDGIALFEELRYGTYYIKEIKVIHNHNKNTKK